MSFTHRELCLKAVKFLRNKAKCKYVVCELERIGESPDAFGFGGIITHLIEVKVNRSDFKNDKNKIFRMFPQIGIGQHRYYMCPTGLITASELPQNWGLLWVDSKGDITIELLASIQPSNTLEEIELICSILRREGIAPKIFSYKKYKDEIK